MDSILHFAIGLALGTSIFLPWIAVRLYKGMSVAVQARRMLMASCGLGVFAVVPNILATMGVPGAVSYGAWTNIFLFHRAVGSMYSGGMLIGSMLTVLCFLAQYVLLVLGIKLTSDRQESGSTA